MGSNHSDDDIWASIAGSFSLANPPQPSNLYGSLLATGMSLARSPEQPRLTSALYIQQSEERFEKRLNKLRDFLPITLGRVIPGDDDLIIGEARQLDLAVLFLDICKFSQIPCFLRENHEDALKLMNLFMAEMLQVVKMTGGDFEKNTGDGLMAYFKEASEADCTQRAVDAAVTMHCYNDQVISPRLKELALPEIRFRIGIETGKAIIANVGVRGDHHSLVAIGNTPNIACKLMNLIPDGGIALGNYAHGLLSESWKKETNALGNLAGYVLLGTNTPFPAWELTYRAPKPFGWVRGVSGVLGGL